MSRSCRNLKYQIAKVETRNFCNLSNIEFEDRGQPQEIVRKSVIDSLRCRSCIFRITKPLSLSLIPSALPSSPRVRWRSAGVALSHSGASFADRAGSVCGPDREHRESGKTRRFPDRGSPTRCRF